MVFRICKQQKVGRLPRTVKSLHVDICIWVIVKLIGPCIKRTESVQLSAAIFGGFVILSQVIGLSRTFSSDSVGQNTVI